MGSGLLSIGSTAMFANQAKMDTISHNISNASTAGYSRQDVELATAGGRYTGAGFFGRGVQVATVSRSTDALLTREVNMNTAVASADQTRLAKLTEMESIFPTGESGLGYAAGQLLNAFTDVANQPQDLSARQVLLSKAEDVASRMRNAAGQLADLQSGVVSDIKGTVAQINSLATSIASLNQKIASVSGSGQPPNDLLDQRDLLIKNLSEKIQVRTVPADDGSVNVFVGAGQQLVLGIQTQTLSVTTDSFDAAKARVMIGNYSAQTGLDANAIAGGSLAGLLKFQDKDIDSARNQLGQMAAAISGRINQQQALGLNLSATSGGKLFDVGSLQVLASSKNTSSLATAPVTMTLSDARYLQASDYSLAPDPASPGSFTLTRLSDNESWSVAKGVPQTIDGFTINIDPAVANTDQFLLRPVGTSAANMKRVLDQPTGIAAASPVTGTVSPSNTGTASVGSLTIVATPSSAYAPINVVFTGASGGGEAYEVRDASDTVIGTGTWNAGSPIAYNGFELKLNGVPKDGDRIAVAPTAYPAGNNGNALALLGLRDEDIVGRLSGVSGSAPGTSVTDAYSQIIGGLGVKVQDAKTSADISAKLAATSEEMLSNKTGVNLDEEAARLIQFQQGYQAAAKILQVAQTVFDTLLSINR